MRQRIAALLLLALGACGDGAHPSPPSASDPPPLAIGLSAFLSWDRLYRPRIGTRTNMRSTYDRAGGNESGDASHFIRQTAPDFNTALDVAGPGVLLFVRTNHWHGSPWHYVVDGTDLVVTESSTADPQNPTPSSVFMPADVFPYPLVYTWSETQGADLNWIPMPFRASFTLGYGRTHYGTGYFIYQTFPANANIEPFDASPPDPDVLTLLGRAGEDIASPSEHARTQSGTFELPAGKTVAIADLTGRQRIVALKFRIPRANAIDLARARLKITWDDRTEPSIDAPLALFFGSGSLYNRTNTEWLVRGLLANIRFTASEVELASYFPMPFESRARIELTGANETATGLSFEIRTEPHDDRPEWTSHFHASYRDHGEPEQGRDLVLLDTTQTEGGGDYCGVFVGTSFIFSDRAVLTTLEGDPRFFFDDSQSPQAYGTGTEEWAGGGDYWGGVNMTLPLAGHPVGAADDKSAHNEEDKIESAYRFLISDAMPFGKNARIQLEHGGEDESTEHYQSVVYWYGRRGACLVQTDAFHVGDEADERAHAYDSPTASAVQTISSRYELGVDHLHDKEIYPESTDTGRSMTGTSELTIRLREDNLGVLLRRKLDFAIPDQRADVFVADDEPRAKWQPAGTWYLAGSNRCYFSNPAAELDPPNPVLQTSNRRFRDDEFLLARELTRGRRSVRLRLVFRPVSLAILPNEPVADLAWSELRYSVYSYVLQR